MLMCKSYDLFSILANLKGLIIISEEGELPNENVEDTRREGFWSH